MADESVVQDDHPLLRTGRQGICLPNLCEQNPRVKSLKLASFLAVIAFTAVSLADSKPKPSAADETRAAFEKIYRDADWGKNTNGIGNSGTGSTLEATAQYRLYLESFMKKHKIKSVVDAGCGDWEFSQKIDWTGIDYKGFDIVAKLVEQNTKKFGKGNIKFFTGNIVEDDLPAADLLISKHVLQHLPNADVKKFLDKQLKKYKHVILTNGVHPEFLTGLNKDIKPGDYRELDITRPPFNVKGAKELTYWANDFMHQVIHISR
jgi:SAM-dependent methyltransferase